MVKFYDLIDKETGNKGELNDEIINNTIRALKYRRNPKELLEQWIDVYEGLNQKVYKDEDLKMVKFKIKKSL